MSEVPGDLLFRDSHEWVRDEGDDTVIVGISDHAQEALGDMVYVELPEVGASYAQGDACAVVESVKAASDIYAPVSGEIVAVNDALEDDPGMVNAEPYDGGWLFSIALDDRAELEELLSADDYADSLEE